MISHVERISLIKFESYWNTTFTHFGLTKLYDPIHLKYKKEEATIETAFLDDFVMENVKAMKLALPTDEDFVNILRGRKLGEEEEEGLEDTNKKLFEIES